MKKAFLYLSLFFACLTTQAQYMQDVNGKPLLSAKYVDVVGSPYLFETWNKGDVVLSDGTTYKELDLKYNQVDGIVFFKGKNGEDLGFTLPVKSFKLYPNNALMSFVLAPEIKDGSSDPYFELLSDGKKVKFLKKVSKAVRESKSYGSASATKIFAENLNYYLLKADGTPLKVKKDKKGILGALSDKSAELEQYIKDNKTNFKEDASVAALVDYYNTL
ncbi:hypothetical protein [Emticicia sp. 17c]|uniref:hypothetical protein n=1 Tax=Emticicia sp. 17c TaxID=3127704 RepID=UPI00301BB743